MITTAVVLAAMCAPGGSTGPGQGLVSRPDLVVAASSVDPSRVAAGTTVTVTFTIRNTGDRESGPSHVRVEARHTTDPSAVFGGNPALDPVPAHSMVTRAFPVHFPGTARTGLYRVQVTADSNGDVAEVDEGNNVGPELQLLVVERTPSQVREEMARPQADFVVQRVRLFPTTAHGGESVSVLFDVVNQGDAAATASTAAVRLSTAPGANAGSAAIPLLHQGESKSVVVPVTAPNVASATDLVVTAIADAPGEFAESDETNNRGSATMRLLPPLLPNLVIENLTVSPSTVARGGSVHLHFQLVNRGDADARAMTTRLFLSSSRTYQPRTVLTDFGISGLQAHTNTTYDFTYTIPASTAAGSYYLGVKADGGDAVSETSENDNISAVSIVVQ
ncbi:MAG TPA: CARDB domain-containing protein [Thermoanaerobaculaceae bacterium]|nr:CARDB domain-containing protein [Thermoanaerobaculaceae bacterium]